jgi:hypothetical protein
VYRAEGACRILPVVLRRVGSGLGQDARPAPRTVFGAEYRRRRGIEPAQAERRPVTADDHRHDVSFPSRPRAPFSFFFATGLAARPSVLVPF